MAELFAKNEVYTYKVIGVNKSKEANLKAEDLEAKINSFAEQGWRLTSTFCNADIEELLVFEKKKRSAEEIAEINKKYETEQRERRRKKMEKQQLEQEKLEEMKNVEQEAILDRLYSVQSSDDLYDIYVKVHDRKLMMYKLIALIDAPVALMELQKLFDNRIDLMTIGAFAEALVEEGKLGKDEETKKYYVI